MNMSSPIPKLLYWTEKISSIWIIFGLALMVGVGSFVGGIYIELARCGAVFALLLQITVELRGRQKRFLTSPLFLLSVIGTTFFSVVQGIWINDKPWPLKNLDFTVFVGSQAEAVILTFCMAALVMYSLSSRDLNFNQPFKATIITKLPNYLILFLFSLAVSISIFNISIYSFKIYQVVIPSFIINLHFIVPPLLVLTLSMLIRSALHQGSIYKIILVLFSMIIIGGLVYTGEGKIAVFILLSLIFYVFRLFDFSIRWLILAGLISLMVVLALFMVLQHTSWKSPEGGLTGISYSNLLRGKGVLRQTETGYCLGNVLKTHSKEIFNISKQTFWIKGLIPRILWKNKPSLSLGGNYAVNYCSKQPKYLGYHSASITLLGQPLIQGGIIGLILHGGILLLVLAAIERMNTNRTGISTAFVVALLPWLIDFDQDFSMYVANAVKFSSVMIILYVPIVLIERRACFN